MADIRGEGADMEGPYSPDRRGATNMSIHPGKPMDVESHPAYNVPTATQDHDGTELGINWLEYHGLKMNKSNIPEYK